MRFKKILPVVDCHAAEKVGNAIVGGIGHQR